MCSHIQPGLYCDSNICSLLMKLNANFYWMRLCAWLCGLVVVVGVEYTVDKKDKILNIYVHIIIKKNVNSN